MNAANSLARLKPSRYDIVEIGLKPSRYETESNTGVTWRDRKPHGCVALRRQMFARL